ncbi:MAG TPA: GntP family permease [Methanoculleus sp.]|nr:GntP family permease [Methanoculleus sp.]
MDALIVFLLVMALVSVISARDLLSPFLTLIGAAIVYGALTGLGAEIPALITTGAGAVFALLGIPIYCGALIAQVMRSCGFIERVCGDLIGVLHRPATVAGIAGYLFSIPCMCCITAFVILAPVIEHLEAASERRKNLYYIGAYGSVLSFVLLYPLPVSYAVITTLSPPAFSAVQYLAVVLPVSAIVLGILLVAARRWDTEDLASGAERAGASPAGRLTSWAPVLVPLVLLMAGTIIPPAHVFSTISVALLAGAAVALLLADHPARLHAFEKGTRNAGVIMFDLCGAGALGSVIAASPLLDTISATVDGGVFVLLVPFTIAALFQTAQGSRVVTAIAASSLLAGSTIPLQVPAIPLVLMIAAGTLVVSYVTDPYFWLLKRTSGDPLATVVWKFTIPLALTGLALAAVAIALAAGG